MTAAVGAAGGMRRADMAGAVDLLLPALISKTCEANARIRQPAREALLELGADQRLGPSFIGRQVKESARMRLASLARLCKDRQ